MSFPDKQKREECWASRDLLWKCLDENANKSDICAKFRETYQSSCPPQWVKHFDRKREYLKFKDRIQNEGPPPREDSVHTRSSQIGENYMTTERNMNTNTTGPISISPNARVYRKFHPPTFT